MPKRELPFQKPLTNVAGILGYAPNPRGPIPLSSLGAFITNPISLGSRTPAGGARFIPFPGGLLLHTGLPNPGLRFVIHEYAKRWAHASLPIIAHIFAENPESVRKMTKILEEVEGVIALELGLPPTLSHTEIGSFVSSALGELPLIVGLPLDQATLIADAAIDSGCAAVSLGPPRGTLLDISGKPVSGRLYGPALFPQGLAAVQKLTSQGIAVIGSGGVYSPEQILQMQDAGAIAVQLDTVLWRGNWDFQA